MPSPTLVLLIAAWASAPRNGEYNAVRALATPARSRKPNANRGKKSSRSTGGGGFARAKVAASPVRPPPSVAGLRDREREDALAKSAASHLFAVCSHIQNPDLYRPAWADACAQSADAATGNASLVATRDVRRGGVLTLFPVHALGVRTLKSNEASEERRDQKKKGRPAASDTEFVAYDRDEDGGLFDADEQKAGLRMKLNIPLDAEQPAASLIRNKKRHVLFAMFLPEKPAMPGWLGGRMTSSAGTSNCVTMPLPGAAPLCAIVATEDVKEGEEIIQASTPLEPSAMGELRGILTKEHERDIRLLATHIELACQTTLDQSAASASASEAEANGGHEALGPFHPINLKYPGIRQIHRNPDLYAVDNFLTDDECARIIAKCQPHLQPCLVNNEKNGQAEPDPARTSTNANVPRVEVPTVVRKMTELANCQVDQLEILQVLHYSDGQRFVPHTDGFSGPFTACGFEQSTRLATVFCYLNDVSEGGSTYFPELDLDLRPERGTAVVHFPADTNMREDARTLHQGSPAVDDKWLLAAWVWERARSDETYAESRLPSLSEDII